MSFFPALRSYYQNVLTPYLPPYPSRILLGAAGMAVLTYVFLGIGSAFHSGLIRAFDHNVDNKSPEVDANLPAEDILNSSKKSIDQKKEEDLIFKDEKHFPVNLAASYAYRIGIATDIRDAVRRSDYALIQVARKMGIAPINMKIIEKEPHLFRSVRGDEIFTFQRISLDAVSNCKKFYENISYALKTCAKNVIPILVPLKDGRYIVRIMYTIRRGDKKGAMIHEVYLNPRKSR